MPLRTLVKVGSITNLSDARYCAGMGVEFLGFRVIPGQDDAISTPSFQDIRGWVTGPQIVAEIYGITSTAQLSSILEEFRPDYLELGIEELALVGHALTLPFMLRLNRGQKLPPMANSPAYIILFEDESVSQFVPDHDLLLVVSNLDDLKKALAHTGISGVCLQGGNEIRPGLKSYDELGEILEALDVDG